MKPLYISLTRKGDIDKAVKALKEYQNRLVDRSEIFVRRLAELGVEVAKTTLSTGQGDSSRDAKFTISFVVNGSTVEGVLSISSKPHTTKDGRTYYPHLGWEFGSGIHFNNGNINPKAHELGMGVGTFPDQTHALDDYWWYRDDNGNLRMSQGTEATMPMYKASIEMINSIESIAREVYGNG